MFCVTGLFVDLSNGFRLYYLADLAEPVFHVFKAMLNSDSKSILLYNECLKLIIP